MSLKDDTKALQRTLNAQGHEVGAEDGILGKKTLAGFIASMAANETPVRGAVVHNHEIHARFPASAMTLPPPASEPAVAPQPTSAGRPISEIIIHCSATKPDWMAGRRTADKVAEIRRWHMQGNGWSDIGYHDLIDRDGTRARGRPIERIGAHVGGHNTGSAGVCLIGGDGSRENDPFEKNFTHPQEMALKAYIREMLALYPGITKISGHNQYDRKACPGFYVPDLLRAWEMSAYA